MKASIKIEDSVLEVVITKEEINSHNLINIDKILIGKLCYDIGQFFKDRIIIEELK